MSENKKTPLQKAILEAREIENAAMEGAKRVLEQTVYPKIEATVKDVVRQLEEGVSIDVGNANVNINVENGNTSVEVDADEDDIQINPIEDMDSDDLDSDDTDLDSDDTDLDSDDSDLNSDDTDLDTEDDFDSEDDSEDEDIFEIEGLFEDDDAPIEAPVEAAPEEVPADAAPIDATADVAAEVPAEGQSIPGLDTIVDKLDAILNKLEGNTPDEEMEVSVGEEAPEEIGAEGEIEIVDDEAPEISEVPAEEMVSEDGSEEITFEGDDFEMNLDELNLEEMIDEIEIVDEEEDNLEETGRGEGFAQQRTGNRTLKMHDNGHHAPVTALSENKNKTQYEARAVELEKENKCLKESLKEYKESFKILRKQINEVQTFNAKLAYVNKLFSKGGLTNSEKIQIAEDFDKVSTVEEAKGLYNQIISESKKVTNSTEVKNEQLKNKLKTAATASAPSTTSETLYESKEMGRMQQLAGIKPLKG